MRYEGLLVALAIYFFLVVVYIAVVVVVAYDTP